MIFNLGSRSVDVRFHYEFFVYKKGTLTAIDKEDKAYLPSGAVMRTHCSISEIDETKEGADKYTLLAKDFATQHSSEKSVSKEYGQMKAVFNTLRKIHLTLEERKIISEFYMEQAGVPVVKEETVNS
jgi:hypothetical protein